MKKNLFIRLSAVLLALFICFSLSALTALAVDDTASAADTVVTTATSAAPITEPAEKTEEELIAEFKAEVIRLVNIERANAGIAPLEAMAVLADMANVRAGESSVSFKHTRPDGTRCFTIFGENALKYRTAGENLAYGFKTPEAVVKAWMNSEGHKRNILDSAFKYIGIGYFVREDGKIYCSQLFYTPKTAK